MFDEHREVILIRPDRLVRREGEWSGNKGFIEVVYKYLELRKLWRKKNPFMHDLFDVMDNSRRFFEVGQRTVP